MVLAYAPSMLCACSLACLRLITSVRGENLEPPTWFLHFFPRWGSRWLHGLPPCFAHTCTHNALLCQGRTLTQCVRALQALSALLAAWLAVMLPHDALAHALHVCPTHACSATVRGGSRHARAAWGACHCMCAAVWELGACVAVPCFHSAIRWRAVGGAPERCN